MRKIKPPVIPTANGEAEFVVEDAESYQDLLAKDRIETIKEIKRGLEDMKRQRGKPATDFFREFFAEKGITKRE
jgi:hypothetical protein